MLYGFRNSYFEDFNSPRQINSKQKEKINKLINIK